MIALAVRGTSKVQLSLCYLFTKPAFDDIRAVLDFPLFQRFVITAFGLYDFACVRVFVNLQLARLTSAGGFSRHLRALAALWVQQVDDVLQAEAILVQQPAQLGLELDFFLQAGIALQGFQSLELLGHEKRGRIYLL